MIFRSAMRAAISSLLVALMLCTPSVAQDADQETLADVRRQLFDLYSEMERLRLQLHPSGTATDMENVEEDIEQPSPVAIRRIDELERELRGAISKIEELEFRIIRIAEDGIRQIKDLEFLLVELGGGDLSTIGPGVPLGGEPGFSATEPPSAGRATGEFDTSTDEQMAFDLAMSAYNSSNYVEAASRFEAFNRNFALSELNVDAHYYRAESLFNAGDPTGAARAYLESYKLDSTGVAAPRALLGLGRSLAAVGQNAEACRVHQEIVIAFPDSPEASFASAEFDSLECT